MTPVVLYRRRLHQIPELGDQLPETAAYVRDRLESFGLTPWSPIPGSVCAFVDAGRPETAAFRADMDALPVTEATGLPCASVHSGKMHACGHDGHTAMALALAEFAARAQNLPRNALFLFQPAEETTGGANPLCETGILERHSVSRVFGLHLWPGLAQGQVFSRPGPLMARSNEVTVTITGKSVHLSRAAEGRDALTAGADYLQRAYALAGTCLPPEEPRVLRFGKMVSGTVRNAVSGKTVLEGSLRTYREETWRLLRQGLEETGRAVEAETGCTVSVHLSEGYPPVWNHEGLYAQIQAALGENAPQTLEAPALAAEDFSFYQQRVPGVFFFLGVGQTAELHAPDFQFDDEAVLPAGVEFLKKLLLLA